MAKWCGKIGYAERVERSPGVWKDVITERQYYGDVITRTNRWVDSQNSTNDNLTMSVQISIVSDTFAEDNVRFMRYIEFSGDKWEISSVVPQRPRLTLTLGGLYNG